MEAFLVKVWKASGGEALDSVDGSDSIDGVDGLRGTVVHLGSGRILAFADPSSLLDFLSEAPDPDVRQLLGGG